MGVGVGEGTLFARRMENTHQAPQVLSQPSLPPLCKPPLSPQLAPQLQLEAHGSAGGGSQALGPGVGVCVWLRVVTLSTRPMTHIREIQPSVLSGHRPISQRCLWTSESPEFSLWLIRGAGA